LRDGQEEKGSADMSPETVGRPMEILLVEDDLEELDELEEGEPLASPATVTRGRSRRETLTKEREGEPGWVTAVAIVGFIIMLWGGLLAYGVAHDSAPEGVAALWADN